MPVLPSNLRLLLQLKNVRCLCFKCALQALDEYASLELGRLNHPAAFFNGIIKRVGEGRPPPAGRPDRMPLPGPPLGGGSR